MASHNRTTIPALILERGQKTPTHNAHFVRDQGRWQPISWQSYADAVRRAARSLIAIGVEAGDTVALLGFNTHEWVVFDAAAMAVGAIPAGIYTTSSAAEAHYILADCSAKVLLVENEEQYKKVAGTKADLDGLTHIVMMPGACLPSDDEGAIEWTSFLEKGESVAANTVDERIDAIELDAIATLIYTSGTTGDPKGVMLSHENLRWTAETLSTLFQLDSTGSGLSYLPLSHIAEQMTSIHGPAVSGGAVYFAESIDKVLDNLKEVQPTLFFAVPRVWEKMYAGLSSRLTQTTGVKRALVEWTRRVCGAVHRRQLAGREIGLFLRLQHRAAKALLADKIKDAIGLSRASICVSGAAPISVEVIDFFLSLDVPIYEVYGQSEDSGPTSINLPGRTRLGSVGRPLPGLRVKIADDSEILVSGPNVFLGYFGDAAATDAVLSDGWLHSGDLGKMDSDGYLHITGRKKDILITSGGKNVAPAGIENRLKNAPLIDEAVLVGDRRKFLAALIAINDEAAHQLGATASFDVDPRIRSEIQRLIDEVNSDLAKVETIKKFRVLPRPLTIDRGELTPTMKVKRSVVTNHFAELIEDIYA